MEKKETVIEKILKDVPFRYINVKIVKGKKVPFNEHNNFSIDQIKTDAGNEKNSNRKSYYLKYSDIFCIDVDESPLPEIIVNLIIKNEIPYTKTSKGYHLYIKSNIPEFKNSVKIFNDFEGDLVHYSFNVWEPHNNTIYNSQKLPFVDWKEIKNFCNITKMNFINIDKKIDIVNKKKKPKKMNEIKKEHQKDNEEKDDKVSIVKDLLNILSYDRADNRTHWINVGMCLKNISSNYFYLWNEFSKRCPEKYDENECIKQWDSFNGHGLNIGSLYHWAKEDNKETYKLIIQNNKEDYMKNKLKKEKNIIEIFDEGHGSASQYFYNKHIDNIIMANNDLYIFNENLKLWIKSSNNQLLNYISNFISIKIRKLLNSEANNKKILEYAKALNKYTNIKYMECISKQIRGYFENKDYWEILDNNKEEINFKNCIFNLKTGKIRDRARKDFITNCLDFDYQPEINYEINKEIRTMIFNICNDDQEINDFMLRWLGYCLTGETRERKMIFIIGYLAENGKSSLGRMFLYSLPIYSTELDNKTFNEGNTKVNKQISNVNKPIRFVIIEELSNNKLDCSLFKKFVDGNEITNEKLYSTTEKIYNQGKIYATSNNDPRFKTDNGVARRGIKVTLYNRFVEALDFKKNKDVKGYYKKDLDFDDKFKYNNIYKMEFIRILIPFAQKYYSDGLQIPEKIRNNFKELCEENDQIKTFIDSCFDITNDEKDRIHKDDFVQLYNSVNKTKLNWTHLMSDVRRIGLIYDRDKRMDGKKGVLLGIKLKNNEGFLEDGQALDN